MTAFISFKVDHTYYMERLFSVIFEFIEMCLCVSEKYLMSCENFIFSLYGTNSNSNYKEPDQGADN